MAANWMRSRDAVGSGEEGSERDGSLRRNPDADLDILDDKITRMMDQMDAQQERIKNLEAALQREMAEKNELKMQNDRLQKTAVKPKGRHKKTILMDDATRKEFEKMITAKNTELREELLKIGEQWKNDISKQILEIKQSQVELQNDMQQQLARIRGPTENLRISVLCEFTSDGDRLREAMLSTENNPHMMPVDYFIKAIRRCSPGFIRLFGYPSCNPVFWFGVLPDLSHVDIIIWTNPLKKIATDLFKLALQQFNECYEMVPGKIRVYLPSNLQEKFVKLFKELTNKTYKWRWGTYHLFYMKEEQQKIVSEKRLKLPSKYRFDDIHPTSDARFTFRNKHVSFRNKHDETHFEIMRKRYECLPTVAVRSGDVLKGVGAFGMFGFYILRGETLAKQVKKSVLKMRVWQESIRNNFWPLQRVWVKNEDGLKQYNESNLWTRLNDQHGDPVIWRRLY